MDKKPAGMAVTERDGYEAGLANKSDPNPYIPGKHHDAWHKGFDAGRAECLSWDAPAMERAV